MEELLTYLNTAGVIGLLSLAVYAGLKGWVYPRDVFERLLPMIIAETIRQLMDGKPPDMGD